jgi:aspartyl-tRNA(Asn)/glutamyl-tRNA(Gln) amidotransferase subunit A
LVDAANLKWIDRPVELKDMSAGWALLGAPGTWLNVRDYWPDRAEDFTPAVRAGVKMSEDRFNVQEIARAIERRHQNNQRLAEVFEDVDIILTPTTATTAFRAEGPMPSKIDGRDVRLMHTITFTYPFNVSMHPGVSVPCGFDAEGLPVGLQIVTRRHDDHIALQLAAAFEKVQPWPKIATTFDA